MRTPHFTPRQALTLIGTTTLAAALTVAFGAMHSATATTPTPPAAATFGVLSSAGTTPNAAEYSELQRVAQAGVLRGSGDVWIDPQRDARVLVDDPAVGRVTAAAANGGELVCFTHELPFGKAHRMSGCGLAALPHGISLSTVMDTVASPARIATFGMASDDVEQVSITLASGVVVEAHLAGNAWFWTSDSIDDLPVRVSATVRGEALDTPVPSSMFGA